jgi:hypothetical protein
MIRRLLLIGVTVAGSAVWAFGQTTSANGDAAEVYLRAAQMLRADDVKNIMSPSASNAEYPRIYPPLPYIWLGMEKQDYDLHAQIRELFHQAALIKDAQWPAIDPNDPRRMQYLNECRNLANEMADAEEYQSLVLLDEPTGFRTGGDLLRLTDSLRDAPGEVPVRLLVAVGLDIINSYHLMVMSANVKITEDPRDLNDLPLGTATQLIARLLDHPDAQAEVDRASKEETPGAATNPLTAVNLDRMLETTRRSQTERDFVAMSLAAHVYLYKHGRWPASLGELKTELPRVPVDPWGDGKQTLGYALIAGGLPDGSDRPLVYSLCQSKDGLFFPTDEPRYGFYRYDGSHLPLAEQKHGGQFRDVTAWVPKDAVPAGPTTRGLE